MTQLPHDVWSYVLDETNEVSDYELWLSTRLVCRLFKKVIERRFRRILYTQSKCEVSVTFVDVGDNSFDWSSETKNESLHSVISDEDVKTVEGLPQEVFGTEVMGGDRLVWLCHESRLNKIQRPGSFVRPEGVKCTPSPDPASNPFGNALSTTCYVMFHALNGERRIFRPWPNVAAQRAGREDKYDWYLFMEKEETEDGQVWAGRALTVPLPHLVRFVFEYLRARDAEAEKQKRRRRRW
jgi:hypothetical protein